MHGETLKILKPIPLASLQNSSTIISLRCSRSSSTAATWSRGSRVYISAQRLATRSLHANVEWLPQLYLWLTLSTHFAIHIPLIMNLLRSTDKVVKQSTKK